jgi:adhesin transport system membrane fusion protein
MKARAAISTFPILEGRDILLGSLPALALSGTSKPPRVLARVLGVLIVLLVPSLAFTPWQQFVSGTGRVIAFDPLERRVDVDALVAGRVKQLYIVENQRVKKGDILVEIQDNDPDLIRNLQIQRDAAISRRGAASQRIEDLTSQMDQLERAKTQALDSARQRVIAEEFAVETNRIHYERSQRLLKPGLISQREYELAKLAIDSSEASLQSARAMLDRTMEEADATISSTRASRASAQAELASAEREINMLDSQVNHARQQVIESPRDGIIFSVAVTEGTFLRPGSPICVVIPETQSRYVEMWVKGMDMPLIQSRIEHEDGTVTPGSPVRLQFDGWPAIQFVGWPSVAIGTFGGEVVFVDPTDDGKGMFRIMVAPKPDVIVRGGVEIVEEWPGNRWLRQGVRAKGWVLLETVPLWKEIWRQLNGFPPVVSPDDEDSLKPRSAGLPAARKKAG